MPLRITLTLPPRELQPNARSHHMAKATKTGVYRAQACVAAETAMFDSDITSPLTDAVVAITYYHKTKTFLDRDNILASLKAAWDGLTDAGVWGDDRDCIFLPVARRKDADRPRVEIVVYPTVPATWQAFVDSLEQGR